MCMKERGKNSLSTIQIMLGANYSFHKPDLLAKLCNDCYGTAIDSIKKAISEVP